MTDSLDTNSGGKVRIWKVLIILFVVLFLVGKFVGNGSEAQNSSQDSSNTVSTNSWVPSKFEVWSPDIAYQWVEKPNCESNSVCTAIRVMANKDCMNNLYAEITLQDKNYIQYDYTNDSQGSLTRGETAELTFNFPPDSRFAHFKLSKISCI